MYANPNAIGSAESLTTEIENVAGSLRLNVSLPFEARRFEFSLPAGEESLDGSNEDEVPVLRRVIDTHAGEVIRTTSLPTVIKEVLIARYGGVIAGNEWLSARATLSAGIEGSTDEEVRNAIEEFEANEPTIMADGGIPIEEESYGYHIASCPSCGEEFRARSEERVRSFISDEHLPVCGEFEPIKVRWEGYARGRISEYNADFENEDSDRFLCSVNRQKTNIVLLSPEEANSFVTELSSYDSGQRTWMNAMQDKALDRVVGEVTEAMRERGFEVGNRDCFGHVTEFDSEEDDDPEPETDGGEELVAGGGSEEAEEVPFDGERADLSERESVILNAIESAIEEVGIIEAERLKFWPAGEYSSDDSDLVALSGNYPEVPAAPEFDIRGKPAYQVREEFDAALNEALPAGINIEHLGGMVTGFYGEPEAATDGGRDEERHEREEQRKFDRMFASSMAPDDARYIMVCHHCGTAIWRKQDSAVVKRARNENQPCECGGEFLLIEDARSEEYDEDGELIEDGGQLMTDGGRDEEPEESEEPPRWRDWSNVKEESESERLMTDGGHRRVPESGESGTLVVVEEASGEKVRLVGEVDHASRCESRVYDGPDDEEGFMAEGVAGYLDVDGRRISFNTASDRVTEHHPEAEEAEDAVEFIGVLVDEEFENDGDYGKLMADGGFTFGGPKGTDPEECPECERLVSRYVNGNRCPYCHEETFEDDGAVLTDGGEEPHPDDEGVEIVADGGFGDVTEILETIEGFESERFRVRYRLEPMADEQQFFASGPDDWRISSGTFILRNEEDSAHLSASQVWDIREIPAVGECPECGGDMYPLEPSPRSNPKNSENGVYCCEDCGFEMAEADGTVVIEYDAVEVNEEELREDSRFRSATFNDHGTIREIARQWVSGGDTFHRNEMYRCDECGRYARRLASLLTWECSPIPDEEFVREHTNALTDEAAVERAMNLYFEEDAVPPGAKKIDNQLWEFAAIPDPARELIEELESMSGDAGYSGWSVERAGWHSKGTGDGHLWVKVQPIEGMYIGGYPEKCGTYAVPQAVINRINESRFYRVTSVKASNSGEDVASFRIEAAEDDRLIRLAMLEDAGDIELSE